MSWDIFVQDLPRDARTLSDIPKNFEPAPIGQRSEIIRAIMQVVPSANFTDPAWGVIDGNYWSI